MTARPPDPAREARLAAALRANLRRRKGAPPVSAADTDAPPPEPDAPPRLGDSAGGD